MRPIWLVAVAVISLLLSGCTFWQSSTQGPGVSDSGVSDTAAPPGSESEEATEPPQARSVPLLQQGSLTQALALPDASGDLLLVDRGGRLLLLRAGADAAQQLLDISDRVDDTRDRERGFKGAAIHPEFMTNGMLFLVYDNTIESDDADSRAGYGEVVRFVADPDDLAAGLVEQDVVLHIEFPGNWFHNMAGMAFGPDGMLYVGVGDGGRWRTNAQLLDNLWGSVLRIDVDGDEGYLIPADNPFVDDDEKRSEIWLYGLRNPWRFAFHPANGDFFIGNTGESDRESVYLYPADGSASRNHGWPYFEGDMPFEEPDAAPEELNFPIVNYATRGEAGHCAMIGGAVYTGELFPMLRGKFIFADHCSTELMFTEKVDDEWLLTPWHTVHDGWLGVNSVDLDADGEIIISGLTGRLYRIVPDEGEAS